MTDRIERLRRFFIVDKAHHAVRRPLLAEDCLAADFAQRKLPDTERAVERLCFMLRQEEPHLFPEERIAFVRTLPNVPELFTAEELEALRRSHWIHERGDVSNINVDYRLLLDCGLAERMAQLRRQRQEHPEAADYITGGAAGQHRGGPDAGTGAPIRPSHVSGGAADVPHPTFYHVARRQLSQHAGAAGSVPVPLLPA